MSDTSRNRTERHIDRPEGVTDPLLWGLALDVADAHQPDENGVCQSLLCAGRAWPCEPWHRAQQALQVAQGAPQHASTRAGSASTPQTGWSAEPPRTLRSAVPQAGRREAGSAASAA